MFRRQVAITAALGDSAPGRGVAPEAASGMEQPSRLIRRVALGPSAIAKNAPEKKLPDGRTMLNIGCGTKMNWQWNNVDFSPYARLAHHPSIAKLLYKVGLLSVERYRAISQVDPTIFCWNILKGIPYADSTFDVVYHSHFLEHIERNSVLFVLSECYRVLKRGGVVRVVVPDLYSMVVRYVSTVARLKEGDTSAARCHQDAINALFEQIVRREPVGSKAQRRWMRFVERFLRRDAAAVGELHRWMYDEFSLAELLSRAGFSDIGTETPYSSAIEGWPGFMLDLKEDGTVYKPGSIYVEGRKL